MEPERSHIDLYCLGCGYNLKGLPGDPRRCPECFTLNPVEDIELSAEAISNQLRDMETAPAWCLLVVAVALPLVIALPVPVWEDPQLLTVVGPLFVVLGGLWIYHTVKFRSSCLERPEWKQALWTYHVCGLGLIYLMLGTMGWGMWTLASLDSNGRWSIAQLLAGLCLAVGFVIAVQPVYRLAKARMEPLQREVAVDIARHKIRERMARSPRRMPF